MSPAAVPAKPETLSAHALLKARTAAAHARVDAAFGRFDLGRRESYVRFLQAHGRVVPAVEAALGQGGLPDWRPRTACLVRDLDAFGEELPLPIANGRAGWAGAHANAAARLHGTVEDEGSCGRLGGLHFGNNTRRPSARTGVLTAWGLALSTSFPLVLLLG